MKTTHKRTLNGKPKVGGKPSRLAQRGGAVIKRVLRPWASKASLEQGDIKAAQRALTEAKVMTKTKKVVSLLQVTRWIEAMRG